MPAPATRAPRRARPAVRPTARSAATAGRPGCRPAHGLAHRKVGLFAAFGEVGAHRGGDEVLLVMLRKCAPCEISSSVSQSTFNGDCWTAIASSSRLIGTQRYSIFAEAAVVRSEPPVDAGSEGREPTVSGRRRASITRARTVRLVRAFSGPP
jgi:hypothetical protein